MDISFSDRVFSLVVNHNKEVVEEEVRGNDELWTFMIPFGRAKPPFALAEGEETVCVPHQREEMDKNGRKKVVTYRIRRIR